MAKYGDFYGQVDFTLLCRLWREHKELFKMVQFKDGQHAMLNANFNERQEPDEHGNTHYLQAACKKTDRKEGLNYYIGNQFKPSKSKQQEPAAQQTQSNNNDDLPF